MNSIFILALDKMKNACSIFILALDKMKNACSIFILPVQFVIMIFIYRPHLLNYNEFYN